MRVVVGSGDGELQKQPSRGQWGKGERGSFCAKAAGSPLARDAAMMMPSSWADIWRDFSFYDDHQMPLLSRSAMLLGPFAWGREQTSFSRVLLREVCP